MYWCSHQILPGTFPPQLIEQPHQEIKYSITTTYFSATNFKLVRTILVNAKTSFPKENIPKTGNDCLFKSLILFKLQVLLSEKFVNRGS